MSQAPNLRDRCASRPARRLDLGDVDPGATFGFEKEAAKIVSDGLLDRLTVLQERLWAEGQRSVLIVLQGIDAAGKDGTIRKVMTAFNPQGCPVASFKVPSAEELDHDFLWRIHRRVPGKGEVGIFNRSHYEDVLVVRVHELVPKDVWKARYDQIVAFEDQLAAERHDRRQVLPVHRQGRAARAIPGALRRPDEALEVRARRPRGAQALGRLHRRLRGRAVENVDGSGAVVRHPGQQEVVPRPRHRVDRRRYAPGARSAVSGTG